MVQRIKRSRKSEDRTRYERKEGKWKIGMKGKMAQKKSKKT